MEERLLWVLSLLTAWSEHLGKAVSSGVVCFNFRKSSPLGHQVVCRSSQGWVLSLDLLCESWSLFPGVWQHQDSLAAPEKGLLSKAEESLARGDSFNRQRVQVAKCVA